MSKTTEFILSNALASCGISMSISFFVTLYHNGLYSGFIGDWMQSFLLGYIIAVPSSMIFVPMVNRFMVKITKQNA